MTAAKILAVDDEPDFETLLTQRFRRQIRAEEFAFRFAHHGEEALAVLDAEPDIELLLLDCESASARDPAWPPHQVVDRAAKKANRRGPVRRRSGPHLR